MLLSSILFASSLLFSNILTGLILFLITTLYYIFKKNKQKISLKNLYFLAGFCFSIFMVNIIYYRNGKIIIGNSFFSISETGIEYGFLTILRIMNMFMVGKTVDIGKITKRNFGKYGIIVTSAARNSSFVFESFKNKTGIKKTYLRLVRRIYREINKINK